MVKDGKRLKQIAHELGVSEGAVKQRLKNAKTKLGAATQPNLDQDDIDMLLKPQRVNL